MEEEQLIRIVVVSKQQQSAKKRRRDVVGIFIVIGALLSVICLSSSNFFSDYNNAFYIGYYISKNNLGELQQSSSPFITAFDSENRQINAKLILLWTAWYDDPTWKKVFNKNGGPWVTVGVKDEETGETSMRYCYLTTNRSLLAGADSLIFHSTDFFKSQDDLPPPPRLLWQKYILFTLEPPHLNQLNDRNYRELASSLQFNWTMSYSRYSEVVFPYGKVFSYKNETKSSPNFIENVNYRVNGFVESFSQRPKDAVWITSDCRTMSKREYFVKQLIENGVEVEEWGKCSKRTPDREWQHFGPRKFFEQYRFYLAFENALCEEYISEKAYQSLAVSASYGVIPVVYGLGSYHEYLPQGSYIDARQFGGVEGLARFLKEVSLPSFSKKKLAEYFKWQYQHYVPNDQNWRIVNGWRTFCRQLHSPESPKAQKKSSLENSTSLITSRTDDIRKKIGACYWTSDWFPETESPDLHF